MCFLPLIGCEIPTIHSTYDKAPSMAELAGVWTAHYHGKILNDTTEYRQFQSEAVETLTLYLDGTYRQDFDDRAGYEYHSPTSTFRVARENDGGVYVYLKGMRYYPSGIKSAESASPESEGYLRMEGEIQRAILCFGNDDLALCFRRNASK